MTIFSWHRFMIPIERLLSLINRPLAIACCLMAIALSGCVKYDTGINFVGLNYGEIVEHIQLGEQLNSFSQNSVQTWLASIEQRTNQAQGRLERVNDREFNVIIPFNNARELVTKINRYFNPDPNSTVPGSNVNAHLEIEQNNFLVVVKNHLIYDIDLSSLIVKFSDPKVSLAAQNAIDLTFSIESPWGIAINEDPNSVQPNSLVTRSDRRVTWQLSPGQSQRIDVVFWLPNSLGIGAIAIVLISIAGYYVKYHSPQFALNRQRQ